MSSYLPQFCCFVLRGSFPSTGRRSHHEVSGQLLHVLHESCNAKDTQISPEQDHIHGFRFVLMFVLACAILIAIQYYLFMVDEAYMLESNRVVIVGNIVALWMLRYHVVSLWIMLVGTWV